ncbi:MAG: TrkH family potassium uptake protein [Rickettsiaceae bacterium H1]|nr:TrkH family potassium uptake protein [Rickettsiaceae bacterium H1]
MVVSIIYRENNDVFFVSILATLVASVLLMFLGKPKKLSSKQVVILTTVSWIITAVFASLPFYISGLSYTDAFFEAMSGITTTGSTIFSSIEGKEKSILIWRSILHGIGGLGIIVSSIVILPFLKE